LAQVSVDTATDVITQIQSDYANKKDSQCLAALLKNTIKNLKEAGFSKGIYNHFKSTVYKNDYVKPLVNISSLSYRFT
jgi:hypothetical protein